MSFYLMLQNWWHLDTYLLIEKLLLEKYHLCHVLDSKGREGCKTTCRAPLHFSVFQPPISSRTFSFWMKWNYDLLYRLGILVYAPALPQEQHIFRSWKIMIFWVHLILRSFIFTHIEMTSNIFNSVKAGMNRGYYRHNSNT